MRIAIQEDMLPGASALKKLENARSLGISGVEFWADGLTRRVPEIVEAIQQTGVMASAINMGQHDGYISPYRDEREAAISALREAMADAVDIGAPGVIFVPHYGGPQMPDLTPYRSSIELAGEMMIWLLRTVSDLAYAIGIELYMQPRSRAETYFLNQLDQAAFIRRRIKDHPYVKIAPSLFHMIGEETNLPQTLRTNIAGIGYLNIADNHQLLPGKGDLDFAPIATALRESGYEGWVSLACGTPGANQANAQGIMNDLPECLEMLRGLGFDE